LRIQPVAEVKVFTETIAHCSIGENIEIAVKKVKVILALCMLRRSKSMLMVTEITILPKVKVDIMLDSEIEDRILYGVLELKAKEHLPKM
jgi:hypothetical protein